jgi:enterochelin esterase-like enzyme
VLALMVLSGSITAERDLLVFVGFDPDRAILLTALTAGGASALAGGMLTGQRRMPSVLGVVAIAAIFGATFRHETQVAIRARGDQGSFDPFGWGLTLLTLVVTGLVVGWALATIGDSVRSSLLLTWDRTRRVVASRGLPGAVNRRLVATVLVAGVLLTSMTVLANLIDYSPDTLFHVGRSGTFGLFGGGTVGAAIPLPVPSQAGRGDERGVLATPGPSPSAAQSPPTQPGTIEIAQLPAPWTGGTASTASVTVYLPGGYSTSSDRYPVVYFVPWPFTDWQRGAHIQDLLDGMISRGEIPPTIGVFASAAGGPFVDSECANAVNGSERMETYLSRTLPSWVDSHFRTIADPDHRTLLGFSQGGYCSAMLLLAHPDVFRQAVAFGGYYQAAPRVPQAVNAWRPWGTQAADIALHSPILQARALPPDVGSKLYIVISGSTTQPFYASQYGSFLAELNADGIPHLAMDIPAAHSWPAVQATLPRALQAVATREAGLSH